jgi:hypothetical protein
MNLAVGDPAVNGVGLEFTFTSNFAAILYLDICIYKIKCLVIDKLKSLSYTIHKRCLLLFIDLDFVEIEYHLTHEINKNTIKD